MPELKYWVWLSSLRGIGAKDKLELLERFGSPRSVYFARKWEYEQAVSCDITPLLDKDTDGADLILRQCDGMGVHILTMADAGYPERLKNIYDPPLLLYVKGRLPAVDEHVVIGVVGTRSCTSYGVINGERLAYDIARGGGVIVTGLARGIDSAAAVGALRANGKVIGVLGCGIDVVYPKENAQLFQDVETVGAIVSEYPPGVAPDRRHFPVRNRIISGLSLGIVVVEAPLRSGALITAAKALEQGRDVFAMPGNVDAVSCRGCNELLREGAQVALSGKDVLETYQGAFRGITMDGESRPLDSELAEKLVENQVKKEINRQKPIKKVIDNADDRRYIDLIVKREELSQAEAEVLEALEGGTLHVDEIIFKTGLPAAQVLSSLTMLEIRKAVKQEPGKRYTSQAKLMG